MKTLHQDLCLQGAHFARLDNDGTSRGDCRCQFYGDRARTRIPWSEYADDAHRLKHDLRGTDGRRQIEVLENALEVQKDIRSEIVSTLHPILRCSLFQHRT